MPIEKYLLRSLSSMMRRVFRAALDNPNEFLFLIFHLPRLARALRMRRSAQNTGNRPPLFLIAGISDTCNLHCSGCYHRVFEARGVSGKTLDRFAWGRIFDEAETLGIPLVLLAGGEPLFRKDVLEEAAPRKNILFPVFTNGTLFNDSVCGFFKKNRNLVPILSMEGAEGDTDGRRGLGIHDKIDSLMRELQKNTIFFGISLTLTAKNYKNIISEDFAKTLKKKGAGVIIYVEYIPVDKTIADLELDDKLRVECETGINTIKKNVKNVFVLSFPGDEKASGGCLAAGRGFFYINARGGAQPCPFSPYSDINLEEHSLCEAARSPLFTSIKSGSVLSREHSGPCRLSDLTQEELTMSTS